MKRIFQLDNQLANQIAAGEVVERPASVVKELVENSIDAGARRVEIDIERGGARLIRIIDDGCGIDKDDLPLALSRHATSKIKNFNDLCAVSSLGFRGEALASIASVSRLVLSSREKGSNLGWQAVTEGRDMAVQVTPATTQEGTCIEVRDLFFNTPARRKFLRTEKTEFTHIEDVVKREALATPEVAFVLKHNGKITKRYPATNAGKMDEKIKVACGKPFFDSALSFSSSLEQLSISGWLGSPGFHRSESDGQFIFVNGRPVKDRLLSHAIRQSYSGRIPQGRFASYVIYIECPASEVDVNVHPTKHEVRFRNPRQIHDFLVKLIDDCLHQEIVALSDPQLQKSDPIIIKSSFGNHSVGSSKSFLPQKLSKGKIAEQEYVYAALSTEVESESFCQSHSSHGKVGDVEFNNFQTQSNSLWKDRYQIVTTQESLWILDCWQWLLKVLVKNWHPPMVDSQPLLMPQLLNVREPQCFEEPELFECFSAVGIELSPAGPASLMLRKLPKLEPQLPQSIWIAVLQQLLIQNLAGVEPNALITRIYELLKKFPPSLQSEKDYLWLKDWSVKETQTNMHWQCCAFRVNEAELLGFIGKQSHDD